MNDNNLFSNYSNDYSKKELFHFGILGMHWGERHYQYEDGSLTPEGREHYGVGDSTKGSSNATANSFDKNSKNNNANEKSENSKNDEKLVKTAVTSHKQELSEICDKSKNLNNKIREELSKRMAIEKDENSDQFLAGTSQKAFTVIEGLLEKGYSEKEIHEALPDLYTQVFAWEMSERVNLDEYSDEISDIYQSFKKINDSIEKDYKKTSSKYDEDEYYDYLEKELKSNIDNFDDASVIFYMNNNSTDYIYNWALLFAEQNKDEIYNEFKNHVAEN